jgi:hypothetical protein
VRFPTKAVKILSVSIAGGPGTSPGTLFGRLFGAPPVLGSMERHCVELGATYVRLSLIFTSRYYSHWQPVVVTASKFILGAGLGIPASALCISRRTPLPLCRLRQSPGEM